MIRIICLVLLFSYGCKKEFSNNNSPVPEVVKDLVRSDSNCSCKSYISSLDYKVSTYFTYGVDNYNCDIFLVYYDAEGKRVTDPAMYGDIQEKAKT